MPISKKLIKYLDSNKIKHELVDHKTVFTAYDKAATLKVKPRLIGKTLVIKTDTDFVMALIPGNKNLDKNKLKKIVNDWRKKQNLKPIKNLDFISEKIMKNKFKGIKIGAVPPFGNLWKLQAFIDRGLLKEKNIFINTGIYETSFKLSPKIFERMGVITGNFSQAKK